jgi:hypothetical protein
MKSLIINVYDEDSDTYCRENLVDLVNRAFNLHLTEDFFFNIKKMDVGTQSQIDELVSNFISADFNTRKFILNCSEKSDINTKLANFAEKYLN